MHFHCTAYTELQVQSRVCSCMPHLPCKVHLCEAAAPVVVSHITVFSMQPELLTCLSLELSMAPLLLINLC